VIVSYRRFFYVQNTQFWATFSTKIEI
jgi:hypothetical protein